MSPSYLLPARLPTSFPNLFGNKARVHSQGLAGQGGVGLGAGRPSGGSGVVGGSLLHHISRMPHRSGLAELNPEFVQTDLGTPDGWDQRERSRLGWELALRRGGENTKGRVEGWGTEGKTWRGGNSGPGGLG